MTATPLLIDVYLTVHVNIIVFSSISCCPNARGIGSGGGSARNSRWDRARGRVLSLARGRA